MPTSSCTTGALDLFNKARELAPNDPTILAGCALALSRSWFFDADGARARAAEASTRLTRIAPRSGESFVARAAVSLIEGNLAAAVEDATHAIEKAPDLADAHALLGRILIETGPAARALQHLNIAAKLNLSHATVRNHIQNVLRKLDVHSQVEAVALSFRRGWI